MARSAVIVGAGIGGITAAVHLARAGFRVTVVDKHPEAGGRCARLVRDGHTFDTGPTLLVMPRLYEAEYGALGSSLGEQLRLVRVDPTYHLVFDDGSRLALTSDKARMRDQVEAVEPGSYAGLCRYLAEGERNYEVVVDKLVNRDFRRASELFSLETLGLVVRIQALVNHYRHMGRYVRSARLKSAFTFQDMYMGLSPYDAPATFSLLPASELADGVWFPQGGMYAIVEGLVALAQEAGVELRLGTTVEEIRTNGHTAFGVRLSDGTNLDADVVVANADLPYVYRELLPPDRTTEAIWRKDFSCSTISFFWGVDRVYDALPPHTLFLADEYRENFEAIGSAAALARNPSLYVHAPARLDPSMAPPGRDTLTAIVPVGHLRPEADQDWDALRDAARDHVFRRLRSIGIDDLRSHISFEEAYTPVTWAQRHHLAKGSTHGLSHRLTQMAYFRPSNRHRRYRNLYFVGASTHPGTGVPIAMVSGRLVAERIRSEVA